MPGFTFVRGNAQKLLSVPLYALGTVASAIVPRRRDCWVFGCGSGLGEGALALLLFARERNPNLSVLWLARDESERRAANALGVPSVRRSSWRGFWATLRARVVVVTHGMGDANRFGVRGSFIVQLWHGIPLKRIQLDSSVTFSSRVGVVGLMLRRLYRRSASSIRLLPAASELSAARLRTAFGLPAERVVVTGDPRDDVLFTTTAADARRQLEEKLGAIGDARVLLYAPTWRDGERDPGIPSDEEWRLIAEYLEASDSLLVLRPHPHGVGDYRGGPLLSDRIRMLDAGAQNDVTPILPAVDLLVTDYSSVAFDFALLSRPIAFLAADVDHYTASRGLYESYPRFSGGTEVGSWRALLELLGTPGTVDRMRDHSVKLADTHHAFRDGRNTARVYDEIVARLREHA